ncbi:MAG: SLC13 family permease [Candidatus Zixiibacteriota bacterium]
MSDSFEHTPFLSKRQIGLYLGPLAAIFIFYFTDLDPANPNVTRCAAAAAWIAIWWIFEAIPISVTALLPVALFPLLGIMSGKATASQYFNHIIFLFIGGLIIALAMERWGLHKRIALKIILFIGASPKRIILGFMAATFFLSMWIANTASTMMMVPMAMAIITKMTDSYGEKNVGKFPVGLLISIAYAASIGGTATLIGTPPNLAFIRILTIIFPNAPEISFAQWMMFAAPFAVAFMILGWLLIVKIFVPKSKLETDSSVFREEYRSLGPIKYEEKIVLIIFAFTVFLWLFRKSIAFGDFVLPGWSSLFAAPEFIDDGTVAVVTSLLLFVIPTHRKTEGRRRLMNWATAKKLNWGIVLLFGGGFALASGMTQSGLAEYIGSQLTGFKLLSPLIIVIAVCAMITFLTELTSNTATTEIFMPILGALAVVIGINPLLLMMPAALSASCAFMLPVATPPNAIVFGTGRLTIADMMRVGIYMNLIGIVLITACVYLVGLYVFDIDLSVMPGWAG